MYIKRMQCRKEKNNCTVQKIYCTNYTEKFQINKKTLTDKKRKVNAQENNPTDSQANVEI